MGNVLRNSSPEQQTANVFPQLLRNQQYLGGLANENTTFTPQLAANDQFTSSLQPNLRTKFTNDSEFQKWVQGFSTNAANTSIATATEKSQAALTSAQAYSDAIRTSLTDDIKAKASAAEQAALNASKLYADAAIKAYDPTALQHAKNAEQNAIQTANAFAQSVGSASNKALLDEVAKVNSSIAAQSAASQQKALDLAKEFINTTYDQQIKQYITAQKFANQDALNSLQGTINQLPTTLPQNQSFQQFVDNRSSGILNTWQQSTYNPFVQGYNQDKTTFNTELDTVEKGIAAVGTDFANWQQSTYTPFVSGYNNDKTQITQKLTDLGTGIGALNTDFSNFKTNPVFGGQLQAPGSGLKISGQSQWELKEDGTGRLCLTIGGSGVACIAQNGDLVPSGSSTSATSQLVQSPLILQAPVFVPPTEKFAYPRIPSHVRMYRQKPQMKF